MSFRLPSIIALLKYFGVFFEYLQVCFKYHNQCTHLCRCDSEYLTNCLHLLWQYHKVSLRMIQRHLILFVMVMMAVLVLYI
jgi:hypothetical protein